jgi:hypothetical protein
MSVAQKKKRIESDVEAPVIQENERLKKNECFVFMVQSEEWMNE